MRLGSVSSEPLADCLQARDVPPREPPLLGVATFPGAVFEQLALTED
jgi:hypothetical protein